MEALTKEDLNTIKVVQNKNGFSVWMTGIDKNGNLIERWVIDGSCVKTQGRIKLSTSTSVEFKTVYDKINREIIILKNL